jgi:hypothetical protein
MIESIEEERLFESCSLHEAGAYKMLKRETEERRSFTGVKEICEQMWNQF